MTRRRLLRRLFLLVVLIGGVVWFAGRDRRTSQRVQANAIAPPSIPVVAAKARKGDLPIYLNGLGSATGLYTVTVRTRVDGELLRMAVREGDLVQAGDLIAEIDPRPFQVQLEQAEGQKERDQALLSNARLDLERYRILYSQDSVAKQQLDTQLSTVHQYEAAIKADQGPIDAAKLQLTYARITSPITGRIGLRLVDPGNIVHATDTNGLAVIAQLQPIAVIFSLSQDEVPQVAKKLRTGKQLVVEAYDRDLKNKIATGALLTIDNQADQSTGTVRLKATFSNHDNALFPNQFVNARLRLDTKRGAILIPSAAVQYGPQSTFVFVVKADNTVEVRNILTGPAEGGFASVDQGLNAGETVVTQGVDKLQQGSRVTIGQANKP